MTVHESGVPTSQEEKNAWLADARKSLENHEKRTGGLSLEELRANLEAASRRFDNIKDQAAAANTSGQLYETVA